MVLLWSSVIAKSIASWSSLFSYHQADTIRQKNPKVLTLRQWPCRRLLLQAMVATAMADGDLADEATATLHSVYEELMKSPIDQAEVAQVAADMQAVGFQARGCRSPC